VKKCVIPIPKSPQDLEKQQLSPKGNPLPCLKNMAGGYLFRNVVGTFSSPPADFPRA
jgi:hypothetical protein